VLSGQHGASDIFLHVGLPPQLRINGELVTLSASPLPAEELESLWAHCGAPMSALDFDGSYVASNGGRFRVNLFRTLFKRGAVFRPIKTIVPALETLGVPAQLLATWISRPFGLVLVTGPTGAGKSTTLAACLEWLNQNYHRHIVTIEDPIEYLFSPVKCLFTQREVGTDTTSFAEGLRRSLRQSPDVILLGEIRDSASAITALQAAETGHLVLATLHTIDAPKAIDRIVDAFPPDQQNQIISQLANALQAIVAQRLLPRADGTGRVACTEVMVMNDGIRALLRDRRFQQVLSMIEIGSKDGMITFDESVSNLYAAGLITEDEALLNVRDAARIKSMRVPPPPPPSKGLFG